MSHARRCVMVLLLSGIAFAQTSASKPAAKTAKGGGADLQATIEKVEKAGWDAFQKHDDKTLMALSAPGYTAVIADQKPPRDAQAAAQVSHQIIVHKYSFSDFKVTPLAPDVALATYISSGSATFGNGKPQDFKLAVTEVWVKHGGQWKSLRYHESEIH
ncbi:MAG TPA: nuclear transport factor 2 family protein [Terriglobales bacterium]|nr:nuclear transport factor 2 family protein [Terriglobales bacterium]